MAKRWWKLGPKIGLVVVINCFMGILGGIHNVLQGFHKLGLTRKYLLRRYILGVLTHTTARDQYWGGDETLILVKALKYSLGRL